MTIENKILSLDPSSTVVGYAVMSMVGRLIEAGPITPAVPSAESYERTVSLCEQVAGLLETTQPQTILIEWTKGKVGRRHHGRGAGLAVYGCGVGSIATVCRYYAASRGPIGNPMPAYDCQTKEWFTFNAGGPCEVIPILENDWTRGVPKRDRQLAVAQEYSAYRISADPGGDASDAIGLARWWLKERALLWSKSQ